MWTNPGLICSISPFTHCNDKCSIKLQVCVQLGFEPIAIEQQVLIFCCRESTNVYNEKICGPILASFIVFFLINCNEKLFQPKKQTFDVAFTVDSNLGAGWQVHIDPLDYGSPIIQVSIVVAAQLVEWLLLKIGNLSSNPIHPSFC